MGPTATRRLRRSSAQLHALRGLERHIRAADPHLGRKYIRDFNSVFNSYESVLEPEQLAAAYDSADVLLVGDYHALAASQHFAGELIEQLACKRPIVLGIETIFARNQNVLDEWWRGEIGERELRERIRFDLDWGYDWRPFYRLLRVAREHACGIYGLDCMPRNDLRRIALRDRHAAIKIGELRERYPEAAVVVLFGESHLAPTHLPSFLRVRRPQDRLLTILQNVDPLYWIAAGEHRERVDAVRVREDVVCVFNSTPLEKYESYRLCIERWREEPAAPPDLAPSFYNMVEALARFLNINSYSPTNHTQPRFLVDQLPEIVFRPSAGKARRLMRCEGAGEETRSRLADLNERGCCYLPCARTLLVREFRLPEAAEQAARFLRHACAGNVAPAKLLQEARLYRLHLERALAHFGSRALFPQALQVRGDGGAAHRGDASPDGYALGSQLYEAYVSGRITKRFVRSLFFRSLDKPDAARATYLATVQRLAMSCDSAA